MSRGSTMAFALLLFGLGLFAAAAVLVFVFTPPADSRPPSSREPHSVTDLPNGLIDVDPEQWHRFVRYGRPATTGWVALPQRADVPLEESQRSENNVSQPKFVGARVCGECHSQKLEGYLQTAHHSTSRAAGSNSVLGNFEGSANRMETNDPDLYFEMARDEHGFYQQVVIKRGRQTYTHRERIDLVIGSGNHGQTYLYWKGDALYQLPVSYLIKPQQWVNSPGFYRDGTADFSRPITARCLECHATYAENVVGTTNRYVPSQTMLGVSCERCHGPGPQHVSYHLQHPEAEHGRYIVHPGKLARQRSIEICAQCHSGIGRSLKPPFSYRPSEPLDEYLKLDFRGEHVLGGVHTDNQLARLKMSQCFRASNSMTCVTCHDPHRPERGKLSQFSERCLQCHSPDECRVHSEAGHAIQRRCIDCHMPKRRDRETRFHTAGGMVDLLLLRDHDIRVWPAVSEEVLRELGTDPSPSASAEAAQ